MTQKSGNITMMENDGKLYNKCKFNMIFQLFKELC